MLDKETLREYAEYVILDAATDIEWMSIFEVAESFFPRERDTEHEITEEEAAEVRNLISRAKVTIEFPED